MRWKYLYVVLILLLSSLVSAAVTVELEPIVNEISGGNEGSYSLKLRNDDAGPAKTITLYSLQSGIGWTIDPKPLQDRVIRLGALQSYTTEIVIRPLEKFEPGIYNVPITIEVSDGQRVTRPMKLYVSPEGPSEYLPAIKVDLDMDEQINPKNPVSVKLFIENRNPLNLTNLQVKMNSDIPEFTKQVAVDLPPLGKKSVEFAVLPNKFQQPKDYTIFFVFERHGETVKIIDQTIEILPLLPEFMTLEASSEKNLRKYTEIGITNPGNVLNTQDVNIPITWWQSLFLKSEGEVINVAGQRYISWVVDLGPNETTTRFYIIDYRPLLYAAIILFIFFLFYLHAKSPVTVTKKAVTHGHGNALDMIKVTMEVRNKSGRKLTGVEITDIVPAIANVQQDLELGTLKPKDVRRTKHGTKVIWALAEIDSKEHRMITYKVKAKLNIVGTVSLPRAIMQYTVGKRKRKAFSNIFRLRM